MNFGGTHSVHCSGCGNLHNHRLCMGISIAPNSFQHLRFIVLNFRYSCECVDLVILSYISLIMDKVNVLFRVMQINRTRWGYIIIHILNYILLIILLIIMSQFFSFGPSPQHPALLQAIPTPLFMSMGHMYKFLGYSISYTVLYIPMVILKLSICTS